MTQFARTNLSLDALASSLHARALRGLDGRAAWPAVTVLLFALVTTGVGFVWRGSTGASRDDLGTEARVSAVVDRLAERLKTAPDAEGWQTVGRSYAALGRHAQAVVAFRNALRLVPPDATLLAEYAASAAVAKQREIDGDPARIVARALVLEPANAKALALAATLAMNHNDYAAAAAAWARLARSEMPGSPRGRAFQANIAQARLLADLQAMPAGVVALPRAAAVSGTARLARTLQGRVSPDDTVIVFARLNAGPRLPVAMMRKQVKDLPLRFTLDDGDAIPGGPKLSSASRVLVGARIARSASALPQRGDLKGPLVVAAAGGTGLSIEINEVVTAR